jgi:hypothetical protein
MASFHRFPNASLRRSLVAGAALLVATCATKPMEFGSAEQAADSLVAALRANDSERARAILGEGADEILSSGDAVSDRNQFAEFVASYDERHRFTDAPDGGYTLLVGAGEWPLPIPIVEHEGRFAFDTEAGLDELLSRRIGRNELDAVQVCLAIVDAQREFAARDPDGDGLQEYARKFRSTEGKRDGLFWPTRTGEPPSPLGPLVVAASLEGYGPEPESSEPRAYHGYRYRLLEAQGPAADGGAFDYVVNGRMLGGFGLVAWPAEYANSGLKTFVVNHAGVVFEQDLGEATDDAARKTKAFDPGAGWTRVP